MRFKLWVCKKMQRSDLQTEVRVLKPYLSSLYPRGKLSLFAEIGMSIPWLLTPVFTPLPVPLRHIGEMIIRLFPLDSAGLSCGPYLQANCWAPPASCCRPLHVSKCRCWVRFTAPPLSSATTTLLTKDSSFYICPKSNTSAKSAHSAPSCQGFAQGQFAVVGAMI